MPEIARGTHSASLVLLQNRGFRPATVIDVGAAEGGFFLRCQQLGFFPGAQYFLIDAMAENEPLYRLLASRFPVSHAITALSCLHGETVLNVDPGFYNTHLKAAQPDGTYSETRVVPVDRLDALVARHGLAGPFLIKLDVQGSELDVLRGSLTTLDSCVIVVTEIQLFLERDNLTELLTFMQSRGFVLYDLTDLAYYPSDNTLYQCYATFIPRRMDFRAKGDAWCTPEQMPTVLDQLRARRQGNIAALEQLVRAASSQE